MQRRDFLASTIAAIAAIPLIGKWVNSQPAKNLHEEILMVAQSHGISYREAQQEIERAWRRERIVRDAREFGHINVSPGAFANAFTDWDWQEIDGWCNDNALHLYANQDRAITVLDAWRSRNHALSAGQIRAIHNECSIRFVSSASS